ncbi:group II truncated hemoglobin [Hydrogenophaga sp. NFH-34]|uniref:group II truncated hemoglobin n=1 Tax=Hydrogenophaga sp. NFH-34 TaxID=2744446 RepID=UPI001F475D23|nr:group II truncated hemoglobin [Hydrogenophaga sp. NFH-34]
MTPSLALTPYEALGGADALHRLVDRFYDLMDALPEAYAARRLHPDSLAGANQSLFEYLSGWFGGPNLYIEKHGHPRLRMRHLPYAIGPAEQAAWMLCMRTALAEEVADAPLRAGLLQALTQMAEHMVNTGDRGGCGHGQAAHAGGACDA